MFKVQDLKDEVAKEKLQELIEWLDELDNEDFFGTEGWKHDIGWED